MKITRPYSDPFYDQRALMVDKAVVDCSRDPGLDLPNDAADSVE
jgi:hypothetical protein